MEKVALPNSHVSWMHTAAQLFVFIWWISDLSLTSPFVWWLFGCSIFYRLCICCISSYSLVGRCGCAPNCVGGVGCCIHFPRCSLLACGVICIGCLLLWVGWRCVEVGASCGVLVQFHLVVLFVRSLVEGWVWKAVHLRIGWKGCSCFNLWFVLVRRVVPCWFGCFWWILRCWRFRLVWLIDCCWLGMVC